MKYPVHKSDARALIRVCFRKLYMHLPYASYMVKERRIDRSAVLMGFSPDGNNGSNTWTQSCRSDAT